MEELIAKRYAKALAETVSNVEEVTGVLSTLSDAMSSDNEVVVAMTSPLISESNRVDMLLGALGSNADEKLQNFIKLLAEHKRLNLIPTISKVMHSDLQKVANNYEGTVKSQDAMDATSISSLEETLHKYTGSNIKLVHEQSDSDGMQVAVEDLGIEVNFSKQRVKSQLIDFIKKSL
jgi:F-type H+-transporting ATPase subunit delta